MAKKRTSKKKVAKRAFEDRHASSATKIDYMLMRCVELTRVLKKNGKS